MYSCILAVATIAGEWFPFDRCDHYDRPRSFWPAAGIESSGWFQTRSQWTTDFRSFYANSEVWNNSGSQRLQKCTFTATAHISELARALDPRRIVGFWGRECTISEIELKSISTIVVAVIAAIAAIAGDWFPYDHYDRWIFFFQRSQRSYHMIGTIATKPAFRATPFARCREISTSWCHVFDNSRESSRGISLVFIL